MKLKQRVGDFRVRELLVDDYVRPAGDFRVYRVTKKKLTTLEAVAALAEAAGCDSGEVGLAGMKDRQAVTVQHMSVPRGPEVQIAAPELKVETAGFAEAALTSEQSRGNAFELTVRALVKSEVEALRSNLAVVREQGLPNYFDDQRFGNLTHEQGWIAKDLMLGRPEAALRRLLTAKSPFDPPQELRFKEALDQAWGDARACREVAGKFGAHHSIFEHLSKHPGDHAGAFTYVASRLRLIHLFAFQSHVWNRAVAALVRERVPVEERLVLPCVEGPLVAWAGACPAELASLSGFRLPGDGLEDVADEHQATLLRDALAEHRLVPDQFRIQGVSGFQLKGEERALVVVPAHLRVRPAEPDVLNRGLRSVRVRFELPRGAYATLVIKRLFAGRDGAVEGGTVRPAARREPRRYGKWHGRGERDVGFQEEQSWESRPARGGEQGQRSRGREGRGDEGGGYRGRRQGEDDRGGRPGGPRGGQGGGYRGRRQGEDERGGRPGGPRGGQGGGYRGRQRGEDDRGGRSGGSRGHRQGGDRDERDRQEGGGRGGWGAHEDRRGDQGRGRQARSGGSERGRGAGRPRPERGWRDASGGERRTGGRSEPEDRG